MDTILKMEKGVNFCQFPHFFKAYIPRTSSQRMKLPPGIGQRIPEGSIPRNLFLRNRSGKRFGVELGSIGNDVFFEGDGWVQFIRDNNIVENHILVFYFDGTDTFEVKIFELNGCEKIDEVVEEINEVEEAEGRDDAGEHKELEEEEDEEDEEEEKIGKRRGNRKSKEEKIDIYGSDIFKLGGHSQPENPYFVTKVRANRCHMVYIPEDVVKELRSLEYELPEKLKVCDPRGRLYILKLNEWGDGRIWYKDGWRRLCRSNLVDEEDTLICEFIKRDEIQMQVHILRAGN